MSGRIGDSEWRTCQRRIQIVRLSRRRRSFCTAVHGGGRSIPRYKANIIYYNVLLRIIVIPDVIRRHKSDDIMIVVRPRVKARRRLVRFTYTQVAGRNDNIIIAL